MGYIAENLWLAWLILAVVCLITELMVGGFYTLCFAVGAAIAAVASPFMSPTMQIVVFAAFTALSIFLVRPVAVRYFHRDESPTVSNADALIGRVGRVTETIVAGGFGRVAIDGDDWKSQSASTEDIPVGSRVEVVGRESIILNVKPIN